MKSLKGFQIGSFVWEYLPDNDTKKLSQLSINDFYNIAKNPKILDLFSPIELVGYQLVCLGFECKINAYCESDAWYLKGKKDKFGDKIIWYYNGKFFYGGIHIKYVHQLQVIYNLLGINLKYIEI